MAGEPEREEGAIAAALLQGLDALEAYRAGKYDKSRTLLLAAIELRPGLTEQLLQLLFFSTQKVGYELAVACYVLPSLGLPDAVIGEMKEKWLSAPDQAPFAQLIAMAKNFPDLQARTEDDVFLTPGNMALTERTVLASRPFGTPDEDYVAVAKDDDTGVRSSTFSFQSTKSLHRGFSQRTCLTQPLLLLPTVAFHEEQFAYLLEQGILGKEFEPAQRGLSAMRQAMESPELSEIMPYGQEKKAVGFIIPEMREQYNLPAMPTTFGRLIHRRPVQIDLNASTLGPDAQALPRVEAVQAQFHANNGIAVSRPATTLNC